MPSHEQQELLDVIRRGERYDDLSDQCAATLRAMVENEERHFGRTTPTPTEEPSIGRHFITDKK